MPAQPAVAGRAALSWAQRSAEMLKRLHRVKKMGVPVRGITTDGEKGLVPAVQRVFPEVPHQLCQSHFLFNCAEPLEADLKELGASVEQRADKVRALRKKLDRKAKASGPALPAEAPSAESVAPPAPLSERELAHTLCEATLLQARVSGKAPLNPRQLARHQRLEQVRKTVDQARKKRPAGQEATHALARSAR